MKSAGRPEEAKRLASGADHEPARAAACLLSASCGLALAARPSRFGQKKATTFGRPNELRARAEQFIRLARLAGRPVSMRLFLSLSSSHDDHDDDD